MSISIVYDCVHLIQSGCCGWVLDKNRSMIIEFQRRMRYLVRPLRIDPRLDGHHAPVLKQQRRRRQQQPQQQQRTNCAILSLSSSLGSHNDHHDTDLDDYFSIPKKLPTVIRASHINSIAIRRYRRRS